MIDEIIELSKKLISIPSVTPNDMGCQKIINRYLSSIGFVVKKINFNKTNNLYAFHGNNKKKNIYLF
ncbi:hypothetical protein RJX39_00330 [Buchnera aphidicola (Taiwanaphis decaspermi)]|uniref:hypothetical protein n=1 Tax=Buchnera aphidicola TaxID=9 RepID=UPI0031B81391